jgi:glycine cleavage system H lipoate-binding protein/ABC-type phosphate transport system substrate-binding protein
MKTYIEINLKLKAMKKILVLLMGILLIVGNVAISNGLSNDNKETGDKSNIIYCTPDLFYLSQQWTSRFCELNQGSNINLIQANPDEFTEIYNTETSLGIISDRYIKSIDNSSNWITLIGREVVVPIINLNNPLIKEIDQQGISKQDMTGIFDNSRTMNWESIIDQVGQTPMNYYFVKNDPINSEISKFINTENIQVKGIEVNDRNELVKAIQNDPNAIGFCILTDVIKSNNQELIENIKLLPIDKNGNRKIDYSENIYNNLNDFNRGVWIGKYPKDLINEIYIVSNGIPENEMNVALIKWILTDGQELLNQNGFSELALGERLSKLEKINYSEPIKTANDQHAYYKLLLLAVILAAFLIVSGIAINIIIKRRKKDPELLKGSTIGHPKMMSESSLSLPKGLYFDKTHTWAFMEKDGIVRVGINDFLHHITGPYTRIKMRNPGDSVTKNEYLFSLIQDGKQLNIYAPFSGKIIDINESLVTNPSLINRSTYNEGWIYKIEPTNWVREIQFLRMAGSYKEWLKAEFLRIKDFLSANINTKTSELNFVAYQEGGELKDNVLKDFGPEVWEDFQKHFIDTLVMS